MKAVAEKFKGAKKWELFLRALDHIDFTFLQWGSFGCLMKGRTWKLRGAGVLQVAQHNSTGAGQQLSAGNASAQARLSGN